METRQRVLIVGGGIGGLSAAIALRRAEIEVAVFERAGAIREIEAGVSLHSTAQEALAAMGMTDALRRITGPPVRRFQLRSWKGRVLATVPHNAVTLHRRDLVFALANDLMADGAVHLGSRCTSFEQDRKGVTVRFADGREERGAVLVGADGIHSVVRTNTVGNTPLRYSGFASWRAMPTFDHLAVPEGRSQIFLGRGARFGIFPSSAGRVYWFASRLAAAGESEKHAARCTLATSFRGWSEPVQELIAATEEADVVGNDVYDRPPVERWGTGRVTLLGDAAHAALPTLGQGAAQAIEDAAVLAHYLTHTPLADAGAVETALRAYEARRIPPTTMVINEAWRISRSYTWTSPLRCWARDTRLRLTPGRVWAARAAQREASELLPDETATR